MANEELKTSVIKGMDAVNCCESGAARMNITIQNIISEFLSRIMEVDADHDDGLALVTPGALIGAQLGAEIGIEGEVLVPRIVRLPAGTAARVLGVGVVILVAGTKLAGIAKQTGALEATSAVLEAVSLIRSRQTTKATCEACVKSKLLSQDSGRKRFALRAGGSLRKRQ